MAGFHDHSQSPGANLASARLGAEAIAASDEFFGPAGRMLDDAPAVFFPDKYDHHGKWMDGWETRRKRESGHDWAVVRLAAAGALSRLEIDTSHFSGNHAPSAAADVCSVTAGTPREDDWRELLPPTPLGPDAAHGFDIDSGVGVGPITHIRLRIFPDGGVARLRVFGRAAAADSVSRTAVETSAALLGGRVIAYSDAHFGPPDPLLLPDRGRDMGDGWETRRRREPGFEWCLIELGAATLPERIQMDTAHFKGNFPHRVSVHGAAPTARGIHTLVAESIYWQTLLPESALGPDGIFEFVEALQSIGAITHLRLNMIPDGGISRFRLFGTVDV